MPAIDFHLIRSHRGSQNSAFEELVSQLARLETPDGAAFVRKGAGADAGVECYRRESDGSETGWQAKYFFEFGSSEGQQLKESFDTAVTAHPGLARYIVCLPFDLSDGRVGKQKTEKQRWDDWVTARKAAIAPRTIDIELWDAFALTERLSRDVPLYVGRRTYWFDTVHFGKDWFEARFAITRAALGRRYTPELNIELEIRQALLALARDPAFGQKVRRWADRIDEAAHKHIRSVGDALKDSGDAQVQALTEAARDAARAIRLAGTDVTDLIPLSEWSVAVELAIDRLDTCAKAIWDLRIAPGKSTSDVRNGAYFADRFREELVGILGEIGSIETACANYRKLLLTGEAGTGKSHLLADVAQHHIAQGFPALLLLGGSFADADPWRQVADLTGLTTTTPEAILGALDAAAEASDTRALVMIDAINERQGFAIWFERLAGFLATAQAYPRVTIVISCRTTFLPYVVSDQLDEAQLPRINHVGFAGHAAEAARLYLDHRGIVRMAAPHFSPEFENPLFLRTCCDALDRRGDREFPRGLEGVSSIFDFYFAAVATTLNQKMGLNERARIIERALAALTDAMVASGSGYIPVDEAMALLDGIHPAQGRIEQDLFFQLENEGVLAVEPVMSGATVSDQVRFTFERLSDHRTAANLLARHIGDGDPRAAFAAGGALAEYVARSHAPQFAGIVEAFAVQLPERYDVELPDLVDDDFARWSVSHAFQQSLLWRNQAKFTDRTLDLVEDLANGDTTEPLLRTLLAIATEPANPFNADYLDRMFRPLSMPERDAEWSIAATMIAEEADNPIDTLIQWTLTHGLDPIDDQRARLAAITLAWLTSLSHRAVRDMATKALATLLVSRRALAAEMVTSFSDVDDPYVVDRVLAAAYGAATRSYANDGLAELAQAAFTGIFERTPVPVHALIRDHARGLIELAAARDVLPAAIDIVRARPPYGAPDPIETITEEMLNGFVADYGGTKLRDEICSSAVEDGDFARYEIDPLMSRFLQLPRDEATRTPEELYCEWRANAVDPHPKRVRALDRLIEASRALNAIPYDFDFESFTSWARRPKGERDAAEAERKRVAAAFQALLTAAEQDEFQVRASSYIDGPLTGEADARVDHPSQNSSNARRWVCWRAHQLGWTPDRFQGFDRSAPDQGRMEHRIERIGKKYQWIALHELAGRLSDTVAIDGGWHEPPCTYDGPWQVGLREMDPTVLVTHTEQRDRDRQGATWWSPHTQPFREDSPAARIAWMEDRSRDVPDPVNQIDVVDPDGNRWFVTDINVGRNQWVLVDGERVIHRMTWHKVKSLLVARGDTDRLIDLLTADVRERDHPPEVDMSSDMYLGEYRWHPSALRIHGDWELGKRAPVNVMATIADWRVERSGHDYSITDSFDLTVPGPLVVAGLDLRLAEGRSLAYADRAGRIVFKDPSAVEAGFSGAVVDRTAMRAFLDANDLDIVWIFSGEKSAHGGRRHRDGWGGMLNYWGVYRLQDDCLTGTLHFEEKHPSDEQLKGFLESG